MFDNPIEAGCWDTERFHLSLQEKNIGKSLRSTQRYLEEVLWLPRALGRKEVRDEQSRGLTELVANSLESLAKLKRKQSLMLQLHSVDERTFVLVLNDGRMARRWRFLARGFDVHEFQDCLSKLVPADDTMIWAHEFAVPHCREIVAREGTNTISLNGKGDLTFALTAYRSVISQPAFHIESLATKTGLNHLDRLEAESIFIMREVVAQAQNPVMLYSIGKDSAVMLHIARKAFSPSSPPFPLLHVDTRWKFQAMYDFRDYMATESGMELLVHINPEGIQKDVNPFDHGSSLHTDIMKTEGLKQALDFHRFDVAFGGARRDEEKSRAKERVFSFRNERHRWDPKNQRPELWNLYNGYKNPGEGIRVFPLSNWTELDIWQYINRERIEIVPLYFSAERPVVERDGMLIMVDDDRMRINDDEVIETRVVRFRTLGCYPLTGAIDSTAKTLPEIVLELLQSKTSEREGRAIDTDSSGSMEKKKQEGYF